MRDYSWQHPRGSYIQERWFDLGNVGLNSDGTGELVLTSVQDGGAAPSWSSDGERMVFHSYQNGNQSDIYTMNIYGGDIVRLTTDDAFDGVPRWAPRKRGVEVSQESIVIPNASSKMLATVQQVTADSRTAVVQIETELGSSSGFVIDPNGIILTNNHVIVDANEITVFFEGGLNYTGIVVGRDLVRDLAVVEIDAKGLPWLELGDISQLSLGSEVLVIGYPLGRSDLSVSRGLASAIMADTGRNITWIQTDSAINPGNSGGPLLDLQGKVVGVVSAKFVGIGVEGLGFAISPNTVKLYLERMRSGEIIKSTASPLSTSRVTSSTTPAPVQQPTIFLSPPGALRGSQATVTGIGFNPLTRTTVTYRLSQKSVGDIDIVVATVTTDEDGAFRTTIEIPYSVFSGSDNVIKAFDDQGAGVSVQHILPAATMVLSVAEADVGTPISVVGAGFAPELSPSLFYGGTEIQLDTFLLIDGVGNIEFDFLLPDLQTGTGVMSLTVGAANASATFQVLPWKLKVSDTDIAGQLTLTAKGFPTNTVSTLSINGVELESRVRTDDLGGFSVVIYNLPEGQIVIQVQAGSVSDTVVSSP